jgi:Zn-dependent proteases
MIVFISVFLHELGHILVAYRNGGSLVYIRLLPIGANAELDTRNCTVAGLVTIYAGGPIVNVILSIVSYFVCLTLQIKNDNLYLLYVSNLYLAVFNLIPVYPLDGGRLIQEILRTKRGIFSSARYLRYITIIISVAFISFGTYQLLSGKFNISLLLIGVYMLFMLRTDRMEASLMNIRQIIYRKSKLIKRGSYPTRGIAVLKGRRLNETIKEMDYDRYHIVYILDNDMKLIKAVTESEIMEAMVKHGGDMTFEVFIENT